MDHSQIYLNRCIKIGVISLSVAFVCNFVPVIYLWLGLGVIPPISDIGKIFMVAATIQGISWFIQPISYFPVLGVSGTYVTWLAGTAAEIRTPASAIAQKAAGYEFGSPEGSVISTLGITTSVFITVAVITAFTLFGSALMPYLPKFVLEAFKYILPAVFAAVLLNFAKKNLDLCAGIAVLACVLLYIQKFVLKFPDWIAMLVIISSGVLLAHLKYKLISKKVCSA